MKAIKARLSKFSTVDEFIHGWGIYYFSGGLLLPTRNAEPVGSAVSLHIQIASGETVLRGEGQVEEVRKNSSGKPVGMVIRFSKLDAASKELMHRILNHKKEARTSANESVAESGSHGLTDQTTGEHLAASEIGAIADALEETFSSIFSGSFASVGEGAAEADGLGLGGFVATPAADVFGGSNDETVERKPLPEIEEEQEEEQEQAASELEDEPSDGRSMAAPTPPTPADVTAVGMPAFGEGPTGEAVNSALDRLKISSPTPPSAADAEAEPALAPAPPAAEEQGLDDQTADLNPYEISGVFVPDKAAPPSQPAPEPEPEPAAAPVLTHSEEPEPERSTSFADAAAQAAAAKAEGEAAFDDMLASTSLPEPGDMPAMPDMGMPVPVPKPKGLIGKLIAWLKGLFGG